MDRLLKITTGKNRFSKAWTERTVPWSKLIAKFQRPVRTSETMAEYVKMNKDEQSNIKDIGGFVGGTISGKVRKSGSVLTRTLMVLDADYADETTWDRYIKVTGCAAVKYSTHKDRPGTPARRFRIVSPYSRPVTPEEHEAVSRKIAELVGMDYFDDTTYQPSRLMYWASISCDQPYDFAAVDGDAIDPDKYLAMYGIGDVWKDASLWAVSSRVTEFRRTLAKKQGNPTAKEGIVGQFCRAYSIADAIETFLPDKYIPTNHPDRWTYAEGSTAAGLVLYDEGIFAYSNHSTDPISGLLVNAFDLIRIHKYADLDEGVKTDAGATAFPSFRAMRDFALQDSRVRAIMAREDEERAREDFDWLYGEEESATAEDPLDSLFDDEPDPLDSLFEEDPLLTLFDDDPDPLDSLFDDEDEERTQLLRLATKIKARAPKAERKIKTGWEERLSRDKQGRVEPEPRNVLAILLNDEKLAKAVRYDEFGRKLVVSKDLPWRPASFSSSWRDEDDSCLRNYLSLRYQLNGRFAIDDSLSQITLQNRFHPVRDWLDAIGTQWDGVRRVDSLLVDYLGADNTEYVRAVTRYVLMAAVKRIYEPGCKFDEMMVLSGAQGIGKTLILSKLGGEWFSNSFKDVENKDSWQSMTGKWLIEIGELRAKKRSDEDAMKNFLSKTEDIYRPAYGRYVQSFPRQCVFIGTVNDDEFLHDATGGRRYLPIECKGVEHGAKVAEMSQETIKQIWAEVFLLYKSGLKVRLPETVMAKAEEIREEYTSGNDDVSFIEEYLDRKIPARWQSMPIAERRVWMATSNNIDEVDLIQRTTTCVLEILHEMFNGEIKNKLIVQRSLRASKKWTRITGSGGTSRFGELGVQRAFRRVL